MQESETALQQPLSFDIEILERDRGAAAAKGSKRLIRSIAIAAKIVISCAVLGYLLAHYAPQRIDVVRVDWIPFAAAILLIVTQVALNAVRWRILLEHCAGSKKSYWLQFQIYYVSIFFSQILPSIGSDVVRALHHRQLGASFGQVALTILLDRGLALIALMLLTLVSLPVLRQINPDGAILWWIASISGGVMLATVVGCLVVRLMQEGSLWLRLPRSVQTLAEATYWILTSRTAVLQLLPLSIFVHLLSIFALVLVAQSFRVPMSLAAALAIGPAYLVAQVIPISVGGWGVREAAAVVLFAALDLRAPDAMLISIAFGGVILLAALPGVLAWLFTRNS